MQRLRNQVASLTKKMQQGAAANKTEGSNGDGPGAAAAAGGKPEGAVTAPGERAALQKRAKHLAAILADAEGSDDKEEGGWLAGLRLSSEAAGQALKDFDASVAAKKSSEAAANATPESLLLEAERDLTRCRKKLEKAKKYHELLDERAQRLAGQQEEAKAKLDALEDDEKRILDRMDNLHLVASSRSAAAAGVAAGVNDTVLWQRAAASMFAIPELEDPCRAELEAVRKAMGAFSAKAQSVTTAMSIDELGGAVVNDPLKGLVGPMRDVLALSVADATKMLAERNTQPPPATGGEAAAGTRDGAGTAAGEVDLVSAPAASVGAELQPVLENVSGKIKAGASTKDSRSAGPYGTG